MFILHLLPDAFLAFVVDAVLLAGILSTLVTCFFLKYLIRVLPALAPHIKIAQIASVAVLVAGVYFKGGYSTEMAWRERVAEIESKMAVAEAESKSANDKIETTSKEKIKIIQEKGVIIKQYVDREVTKYDNTCVIPDAVVKAHNAAARNETIK